jgi:hypothetical protein
MKSLIDWLHIAYQISTLQFLQTRFVACDKTYSTSHMAWRSPPYSEAKLETSCRFFRNCYENSTVYAKPSSAVPVIRLVRKAAAKSNNLHRPHHVCPSTQESSTATGRLCVKFYISDFYQVRPNIQVLVNADQEDRPCIIHLRQYLVAIGLRKSDWVPRPTTWSRRKSWWSIHINRDK